MLKKITALFTLLVPTLFLLVSITACREQTSGELEKEVLFHLGFGKMEDQINLYEDSEQDQRRKNRIIMKNGFFYLGNGLSGKVMEFNSYGDILNLYYNEEMNPEPVLLTERSSSEMAVTRNLYPYPFLDVGEIAVGKEKSLFVDDRIAENRQEFDEELGIVLDRIVLQFDREGRFIDYLGQEGSGGTPFPYVEKIRVTERDELVVFSRHLEGWRIFWFSADEKPLFVVDIRQDQLPVPDTVEAPDVIALMETLECDPLERRIYVKVDYYADSIAQESGDGNGFGGSYIWWLDVADGNYGGSVRIPNNQKDAGKPSIYEEKSMPLMYEFIGVARGGHLFLMSLQGRNSYRLMILKTDGLVVKSGIVNYGDDRLMVKDSYVSPSGILSAFLGWEQDVEVAWWRTDRFLPQEEQ